MTFEEFQASKVHVANTNVMTGISDEDTDGPRPGWVYAPDYTDGNLTGGFIIDGPKDGPYGLVISNMCWGDEPLAKLERILWDDFADGEVNREEFDQ